MKSILGALLLVSSMSAAESIHEFTPQSIDGKPAPLSSYKGKVALLVNVASN